MYMPTIKLNRFSRSQDVSEGEPAATETKKKRTYKRKSKLDLNVIEETEQEPQYHTSEPEPETDAEYTEPESEIEQEEPINEGDNFLQEFDNQNYKDDPPSTKPGKEPKPIIFKLPKAPKQKPIKSMLEDDDSLFDEVGSEIIGRDRREIISKLNQYKNLFPDELKKFKVKKNATTEELQVYLSEMECIVDTSSVENFLTDSILQCIRMIEGVSSYSNRYDIRGCADLLKSNKQFHSLCKQLYVKYKVFSKIPCEYQMLMLVSTTAYICNHKNKNKDQLDNYLNQPI